MGWLREKSLDRRCSRCGGRMVVKRWYVGKGGFRRIRSATVCRDCGRG